MGELGGVNYLFLITIISSVLARIRLLVSSLVAFPFRGRRGQSGKEFVGTL